MDPYSFGGDPVNGVDLYGLWKIGLGITIGWDSNSGFSVGVGAAADVGDYGGFDLSATRSFRDGSWTYTAGSTVNVNVYGWNLYGGGSYSYNSHTGSTLSGFTGANYMGYGGGETGGSLYWDKSGNYQGATLYQEFYGGIYGMRSGTGYEWGFGGMEGRGLYQEASGYGFYASYAQNGGLSYGGSYTAQLREDGNREEDKKSEKYGNFYIGLSIPQLNFNYDFASWNNLTRNDNQPQGQWGRTIDEAKAWAEEHGMNTEESSGGLFNFFHDDTDIKLQMYDKNASFFTYNNYEAMYDQNGNFRYGSYNYGSNSVSHVFLDVVPYMLRNL